MGVPTTNPILFAYQILFLSMRVLLLGAEGYVGEHLFDLFELRNYEVMRVTRSIVDFDGPNVSVKFENLLDTFEPHVVINAIGGIDSGVDANITKLFNSILLPTFSLFRYYSRHKDSKSAVIYILGSTAAGEPRVNYPFYASLKYAEVGLTRSAEEIFVGSRIEWRMLMVPRLAGGLADNSNEKNSLRATKDEELESIADTILRDLETIEKR